MNPRIDASINPISPTGDSDHEPLLGEPRKPVPAPSITLTWRQIWALLTLVAFLAGTGSGYLLWGGEAALDPAAAAENLDDHTAHVALARQINPPEGYTIAVRFGDAGPQLLAAGAIDRARFAQLYQQAGQPLTAAQLAVLDEGSEALIVFDKENAYFLLNFFWAVGLANENPILTEGPMIEDGLEQIGRFASTGGWTLGSQAAVALYAASPLAILTPAQQERLEEVAMRVYRPCCNNPTHFPDCNHGMAMLGLLELMASQDASTEEMFAAAKYANAYWYPNETFELAQFFKVTQDMDFADVDGQLLLGRNYSSGSGFQAVRQWLTVNNLLPQDSGSGSNCGV